MTKNERRAARQPATKFAHLQKKMQRAPLQLPRPSKKTQRRTSG